MATTRNVQHLTPDCTHRGYHNVLSNAQQLGACSPGATIIHVILSSTQSNGVLTQDWGNRQYHNSLLVLVPQCYCNKLNTASSMGSQTRTGLL